MTKRPYLTFDAFLDLEASHSANPGWNFHGGSRNSEENAARKLAKKIAPLFTAEDRDPRFCHGRVIRLADMSPEKQAEMRRLYERKQ